MMGIRDNEGNVLTMGRSAHGGRSVLVWICDGEEGATIDRGSGTDADAIGKIADEVCAEMAEREEIELPAPGYPYRFDGDRLARKALRTIKDRLDATEAVLPEWAQTAMREGWTPPRGWMGKQPRRQKASG